MLLLAILAILSDQGSLQGMERFAKRHRKTINELLGTHIANPPSDTSFRLLLAQLDVEGFEVLLVQADALHANRSFSPTSSGMVPTS